MHAVMTSPGRKYDRSLSGDLFGNWLHSDSSRPQLRSLRAGYAIKKRRKKKGGCRKERLLVVVFYVELLRCCCHLLGLSLVISCVHVRCYFPPKEIHFSRPLVIFGVAECDLFLCSPRLLRGIVSFWSSGSFVLFFFYYGGRLEK